MAYRWTFGKDALKLEKLLWAIHNKYVMVDYDVTMELEKVDYGPSKSCLHLKITLRKELGPLVEKYRIAV